MDDFMLKGNVHLWLRKSTRLRLTSLNAREIFNSVQNGGSCGGEGMIGSEADVCPPFGMQHLLLISSIPCDK